MYATGIDFETTGFNPGKDRLIEVGLCEVDLFKKTVMRSSSFLIKPNYESLMGERIKVDDIGPFIHGLTGIDEEMIRNYGVSLATASQAIRLSLNRTKFFVAHNKDFEDDWLNIMGIKVENWIDTQFDLPLPFYVKPRDLVTLCALHRIPLLRPHRALDDARSMMELLFEYDINTVIERSKFQKVECIAQVSYQEKDKAYDKGFYWNRDHKIWFKIIKQCDFESLKDDCDFPVTFRNLKEKKRNENVMA